MSGSNNSKGGRSGTSSGGAGRRGGWEEAGAEFYQESYPAGGDNIATLLPSKHHRTMVRRIRPAAERRQSTAARGTSASRDVLVSMLPDLSENLSNEEGIWEEIMQLKAMPVPMAQKRELKGQLQSATKLRLQGLEQLKWKRRKAWQGTRARIKETLNKLQLWKHSFKTIEGNFGTGVVAYFLLIKWLLFLNLAISSLVTLFVILPSIIFKDHNTAGACNAAVAANSTDCCIETYLNSTSHSDSNVLDIIQGTGWMERTWLFYGMYSHRAFVYYLGGSDANATLFTDDSGTKMYYNLPLAYVLVPIVYFLLSLIAIVKSAAKGFKERLVEGEGQFYQYCNLIFGGWDFCIHNEKSANIKNKALYNEMKGCLEEERLEEERQSRSKEEQVKLVFVRILINIIVISILILGGLLIFQALNFSVSELNSSASVSAPLVNDTDTVNDNSFFLGMINVVNSTSDEYKISQLDFKPDQQSASMAFGLKMFLRIKEEPELDTLSEIRIFVLQYLPSLCIVGLNIMVPMIFQYLIRFEYYSPAFVVKLTLFRTVFVRLASLGVLLIQLYILINSGNVQDSCSDSDQLQCWETYVGQQLYKLLIADFAVQVLVTFLLNFPRSLFARHTQSKFIRMIGEQEFDLPKHVLDVVYSQTLCWLGAFYCPMLPLIATVLCFFTFYLKKFACLVNSKPASTVYRASRSNSLFMLVLLISFCIAIIPVGYAVAEIAPSRGCGPFKTLSNVWEEIIITFQAFPQLLRTAIFLMGTSVFAIPAFIVLILLLYYYWAVTDANRHMVAVLKSQLVLEGHDKQFLLNRLSAFIRQQQKRNERARTPRAANPSDDSSGQLN